MASPVPPVELVEFFMQHRVHRPIQKLAPLCDACVDAVCDTIEADMRELAHSHFEYLHELRAFVLRHGAQAVARAREAMRAELARTLEVEESYIFTDDAAFAAEWASVVRTCATASSYPAMLRTILVSYTGVVVEATCHTAPKAIVLHVRRLGEALQATILAAAARESDVAALLVECPESERVRAELTYVLQASDDCLRAVDDALRAAGGPECG
jgi:hypothetical protein